MGPDEEVMHVYRNTFKIQGENRDTIKQLKYIHIKNPQIPSSQGNSALTNLNRTAFSFSLK